MKNKGSKSNRKLDLNLNFHEIFEKNRFPPMI